MRGQRLKLYQFVQELLECGQEVLGAGLALQPEQLEAARQSGRVALSPEQAELVMRQVAKRFCFRNAKGMVYIPESVSLELLERDALIWAAYQQDGPAPLYARKFSPERVDQLAAEFDLSRQMVYRIVQRQRQAELSDLQGELPGLDAPE